ncbi:MFS monocarboxylic acid transporter [Pseudohyphozyma bogoriensis]|nr:MFS monocarboxylic acid transporter [Pseudohyphozyma bogoriensis]
MPASRWLNALAICLNCLGAGSIQLFPLVSVPLARNLHLSASQTAAIASSAIAGQYTAAAGCGALCDSKGPGVVSGLSAVLFGGAYAFVSWRYKAFTARGTGVSQLDWIAFCVFYFLSGAGTAASYFSALVASTGSLPARHAGVAIGVPLALLGLSPLFLSPLASVFTSNVTNELDPGDWLLFLAVFLAGINLFGAAFIKVLPWEESEAGSATPPVDSGFAGSERSSMINGNTAPTERTALLPTSIPTKPARQESQPFMTLLSDPTFWLFGLVILCSTGPCEMVMASLGGLVESLLGIKISGGVDSRGLGLRSRQVQIISVANTVSRLGAGVLSDWFSYSAAPPPPHDDDVEEAHPTIIGRAKQSIAARLRRPPRISRLAFILAACLTLVAAFLFVALGLEQTSQLWILSVAVGTCYGTIFTLAPAVLRTVYPPADFGRTWGCLSSFSAVGAVIFTPLYGFFTDRMAARQQSPTCYGRACWEEL